MAHPTATVSLKTRLSKDGAPLLTRKVIENALSKDGAPLLTSKTGVTSLFSPYQLVIKEW